MGQTISRIFSIGWLGLVSLLLGSLLGCPPYQGSVRLPNGAILPGERQYPLEPGRLLQIPIKEDDPLVHVFHVRLKEAGLFQFETFGKNDTLCALVHRGSSSKTPRANERFVLVRDTGGEGENCRLIWELPPGEHWFKVRVDGSGFYRVGLRRLSWGKTVPCRLQASTSTCKGKIAHPRNRHQVKFRVHSARLVQVSVKSSGRLQCQLRRSDGSLYYTPNFRQPYGACTLGRFLQPGTYFFTLRSDRPKTSYRIQIHQIKMEPLPSGHIVDSYIHPQEFQLFRVTLQPQRRHVLESHGEQALLCTLEDRLGHVVAKNSHGGVGHNCRLEGQFKPGRYYLRVHLQRGKGGPYQISFRQHPYRSLKLPLQRSFRLRPGKGRPLYRLQIQQRKIYRIHLHGQPLRCVLSGVRNRRLRVMDLSEKDQCLFFADLAQGTYFLQVYPSAQGDSSYKIDITEYNPPKQDRLRNKRPLLIGPVRARSTRQFKLAVKKAKLIQLETRGRLDTYCTLETLSGSVLARDDDSGERYNCRLHQYLMPGNYRIKIRISRYNGLFWVQLKEKPTPWIRIGKPINSSIKNKKTPDIFLLRVKKRGFFVMGTRGKKDTLCVLLDSSGQRLAKDDDKGPANNCFLSRFLTPGVYLLRISLHRGPGKYQAFVESSQAQQLSLGQFVEGNLSTSTGTNLYQLEIQQPGLYEVSTRGSLDTDCYLLNGQGKQIEHNDDAGGGDKNCRITRNLPLGHYFLLVKRYTRGRSRASSTSLLYRVGFREKKLTAQKLPIGGTLSGQLSSNSLELYQFVVTRRSTYRIETKGHSDPKCYLFDANRLKIGEDDDSGLRNNCQITRRLSPGTYYIQVRPASSRARGPYQLRLSQQGP